MKKRSFLLVVSMLLLSILAWGREDRLVNRGFAPAATGEVVSSKDHNGNTSVEVKVEHLAAPATLTPARQYYVVWVQPRGEQPQAQGILKVNTDLKGSLKTSTPAKVFDVFVTAEDSPNPVAPSGDEVLRGSVQRIE